MFKARRDAEGRWRMVDGRSRFILRVREGQPDIAFSSHEAASDCCMELNEDWYYRYKKAGRLTEGWDFQLAMLRVIARHGGLERTYVDKLEEL